MKTIIEFDNVEEKTELLQALNAGTVYAFLDDLDRELRNIQKYEGGNLFGQPFEDIDELVEIIRREVSKVLID